jgi:DNA-binding transcriptional LysR family regulator
MIETIQPYLYTFYLVASHRSFTKTAVALRIAQSAVSIQIKKLEDILQIQLFHRQSRLNLCLTNEGAKLFITCTEIFNKLTDNLAAFDKLEDEATLTVNAPSYFGTYVLLPYIAEFEKTHPKVRVNFQITDN